MEDTVKLGEIARFLDMEAPYLKMALTYFAPELMEPYKDWDIEDDSLNDKYIFPDTKETWKLVSFTVCNSFISDMAEATEKARDLISILGVFDKD